jgi:hypothetical protein
MKCTLLLLSMLCMVKMLSAQYIYTIRADSVKITNSCDTAELIIENHTQNIPGFLFNKGKGRTEFRQGLFKLDDSTYIIGNDTLRVITAGAVWLLNGNAGTNPGTNFLGTTDYTSLVFRTDNTERARFSESGNMLIGTTDDFGETLQVNGFTRTNSLKVNLVADTNAITIKYHNPQTNPAILFYANNGFFEYEAARIHASASNGVAFGASAGKNATSPAYIAFGNGALSGGNATGNYPIAIGNGALLSLTTGADNIGIGNAALSNRTTGNNNVAIGSFALQNGSTGVANTSVGRGSLQANNGNNNVALGTSAGSSNSSGNNNTFIGASSGINGSASSGNVFVGYQAGALETGSNLLYIHNSLSSTPLIYGSFSSSLLRANATTFQTTGSSFFGGTTSPAARVHIAAGTTAAGTAPLKLSSGTVLTTPEDGAIEYDGTDFYVTQGATRYKLSKTLAGQLTTDFGAPALTTHNAVTTTLSVTGAQTGDVVTVSANSGAVNPASIIITAYVTSANTVTLQAYNAGSSTINIASDTYKVRIIR